MQLHQLRYFVAVAQDHHFSRAAARIHVAQPSISRQIRLLEDELGVALFHRAPGHVEVELTKEGAALLPWARQVLDDIEDLAAEARSLVDMTTGLLSVGATPSLSTAVLPKLLTSFHRNHPGVALEIAEAGSRALVPRVAAGDIDVALVVLPVDDERLDSTGLFTESLVVALADSHPLAGRRTLRIADLNATPMVMFREGYDLRVATLHALTQAQVRPIVTCEGGEMDSVLALVRAGIGAAIVPELVARNTDVHILEVTDAPLRRHIGFVHRNDRPLPRPAQAFVSQLIDERTGMAASALVFAGDKTGPGPSQSTGNKVNRPAKQQTARSSSRSSRHSPPAWHR
jgi:DNA-binding transcriptional LysR family regulator